MAYKVTRVELIKRDDDSATDAGLHVWASISCPQYLSVEQAAVQSVVPEDVYYCVKATLMCHNRREECIIVCVEVRRGNSSKEFVENYLSCLDGLVGALSTNDGAHINTAQQAIQRWHGDVASELNAF